MRRRKILGIIICGAFLFVSCGNKNIEEQIKEIETTTIEKRMQKTNGFESKEFNLGKEVYRSKGNKEMPYEIRGTISMPKIEGKLPLVFMIHGSHDNENTGVRFDTGFKYIADYLAENGYIAITLDVQNAYVWKYGDNDDNEKVTAIVDMHLKKLKEANDGKNNKYEIDLKDKIDFENIGLIGHSRGGETIFNIADNFKKEGQEIKSLIAVAPTAIVLDKSYLNTDVNTGIVVPEYDGDVIDLSGIEIFDILTSKERKNLVQLTYLEKANHNYFNSRLTRNDAELLGEISKNQLSKETQQNFLKSYILDFLDATIREVKENTIYDTEKVSVTKMYGCDVKTLYTDERTEELLNIKDLDKIRGEKVEVLNTQDAIFFKDDKSRLNSVVGGTKGVEIRELLTIKWEELNGKVSFTPNIENFKEYKSISFNIVQDPSDELNKKKENKIFKVQIKDKAGRKASVELNNEVSALKYIDGKLEDLTLEGYGEYKNWSKITPITELRIPLKDFDGINLEKIEEISLIFDREEQGSIDISKIQLK